MTTFPSTLRQLTSRSYVSDDDDDDDDDDSTMTATLFAHNLKVL